MQAQVLHIASRLACQRAASPAPHVETDVLLKHTPSAPLQRTRRRYNTTPSLSHRSIVQAPSPSQQVEHGQGFSFEVLELSDQQQAEQDAHLAVLQQPIQHSHSATRAPQQPFSPDQLQQHLYTAPTVTALRQLLEGGVRAFRLDTRHIRGTLSRLLQLLKASNGSWQREDQEQDASACMTIVSILLGLQTHASLGQQQQPYTPKQPVPDTIHPPQSLQPQPVYPQQHASTILHPPQPMLAAQRQQPSLVLYPQEPRLVHPASDSSPVTSPQGRVQGWPAASQNLASIDVQPVTGCLTGELVFFARAMAALRWYDERVLQTLLTVTERDALVLNPMDASTVLFAVARLGNVLKPVVPPPRASWCTAMAERVWAGAGRLHPGTIAQAMHALALLRHVPTSACLEGLLARGLTARLDEWQGPALATVLWSLATLGVHPGRELLDAVMGRSDRCNRSYGRGVELGAMLWALAKLRYAPPHAWMEHFLWQVQRRLSACNSHSLSNIMWALARLQYKPPPGWIHAVLHAASRYMGAGIGRSHTLYTLRPAGPPERTAAFQPLSATPLTQQGPPQAARSKSRLSQASRDWVRPTVPISQLPTPQAFSNFLWALAKLKILPRARLLRDLCAAMTPMLPRFGPRDISTTLWALQQLQFVPDEDWMMEVQLAARARLHLFDPLNLVILLTALGRLTPLRNADGELLLGAYELLTPCMQGLSLQSTVGLAVALGNLSNPRGLPRALHEGLLVQVHTHLPTLSLRPAANVAWALARLSRGSSDIHLRSGLSLFPRLASQCAANLDVANWADLAQFVTAFALADYLPGEDWLSAHEDAAARLVTRQGVTSMELFPVLAAFEKLRHKPVRLLQVCRALALRRRNIAEAAAAAATALTGGQIATAVAPRVDQRVVATRSAAAMAKPRQRSYVAGPNSAAAVRTGATSRDHTAQSAATQAVASSPGGKHLKLPASSSKGLVTKPSRQPKQAVYDQMLLAQAAMYPQQAQQAQHTQSKSAHSPSPPVHPQLPHQAHQARPPLHPGQSQSSLAQSTPQPSQPQQQQPCGVQPGSPEQASQETQQTSQQESPEWLNNFSPSRPTSRSNHPQAAAPRSLLFSSSTAPLSAAPQSPTSSHSQAVTPHIPATSSATLRQGLPQPPRQAIQLSASALQKAVPTTKRQRERLWKRRMTMRAQPAQATWAAPPGWGSSDSSCSSNVVPESDQ